MSIGIRTWRIARWFLGIFAVLFFGFFYGFVPWFLTNIATTNRFHFHDPNDGKTPQSFGMPYRDIAFTSTEGIPLKGWYVPADGSGGAKARGTIIYVHGQNRTRVEMLPDATFGHQTGYDGLLFDLRHAGESGGKVGTIGYQERHDVVAAVHYALEQEHAPRPIIVWGVSMGAAAALLAAAESPDIQAVISDSTFLSFSDTVRHHYYLFLSIVRRRWWWFPRLPGFPIVNEVIHWAAWRGRFNPADFDMRRAVEHTNPRPILFIAVEGDPRMPPEIAWRLYTLSTSPLKMIAVLPGDRHGEGFKNATTLYEKAVKDFLARLPAQP